MTDETKTEEQTEQVAVDQKTEGQELATVEAGGDSQLPSASSMFTQALAAAQSGMDAANVAVFVDMANKQQDREAERRFRMAKHQALMAMPSINKRGAITNKQGAVQSRYSKWEDIDRVIRPILSGNNLILTFNVGHEGQLVTVQPILSYADGELAYEEKGGWMVLAVDTTGSKNATQGAGSSTSYGKRHSAKAMLNIIEEGDDDDGQGGVTLEQLEPVWQNLVDEARSKAQEGSQAYATFFTELQPEERGFLAFNFPEPNVSWHAQNKAAAEAFDQGQGA